MRLKEISALVLAFACCTQLASADSFQNPIDTAKVQLVNSRQISTQIRKIERLTKDYGHDPGSLHIQTLLAQQFLPSKLEVENNDLIQDYIDKYSSPIYRNHLSKMLGLSNYYFPIFEKAFVETGVPLEIKYLAIIESSLNPNAVSRMGATGPWQFMHATAKEHGLTIDSYMDERKDPISSSYAAANYLKDAFNYYQDWLLAIASYNCGRGNVNKAIQRSGLTNPDFWEIRHLLPRETQNYIPAFVAMWQVLESHDELGISAGDSEFATRTETIMVDRQISLTAVAQALSLPEKTVLELNPSYKRNVIKGSKDNLQRLVVPHVNKASYANLYSALQGEKTSYTSSKSTFASNPPAASKNNVNHQVKKGETLEKIALIHEVTIQDLKVWNRLKNHIIVPGQRLKIEKDLYASGSTKTKAPQYLTHRVKPGDTLSGIAKRYKVKDTRNLKAMNNLTSNILKIGMTLKVSEI